MPVERRQRACRACRDGHCELCNRITDRWATCEHRCLPPSGQLMLPLGTDSVADVARERRGGHRMGQVPQQREGQQDDQFDTP